MSKDFNINVSRSEAIRRYFVGTAMIGAVLVSTAIPAWVALIACYPIFTAMIQWDPVNAVSQRIVNYFSKSVKDAMFRKSIA
ncbi:MAG: DUF2892 domain-containing protein [Gammaproteobacteria bacterium]|jgi:hypothetical protein